MYSIAKGAEPQEIQLLLETERVEIEARLNVDQATADLEKLQNIRDEILPQFLAFCRKQKKNSQRRLQKCSAGEDAAERQLLTYVKGLVGSREEMGIVKAMSEAYSSLIDKLSVLDPEGVTTTEAIPPAPEGEDTPDPEAEETENGGVVDDQPTAEDEPQDESSDLPENGSDEEESEDQPSEPPPENGVNGGEEAEAKNGEAQAEPVATEENEAPPSPSPRRSRREVWEEVMAIQRQDGSESKKLWDGFHRCFNTLEVKVLDAGQGVDLTPIISSIREMAESSASLDELIEDKEKLLGRRDMRTYNLEQSSDRAVLESAKRLRDRANGLFQAFTNSLIGLVENPEALAANVEGIEEALQVRLDQVNQQLSVAQKQAADLRARIVELEADLEASKVDDPEQATKLSTRVDTLTKELAEHKRLSADKSVKHDAEIKKLKDQKVDLTAKLAVAGKEASQFQAES